MTPVRPQTWQPRRWMRCSQGGGLFALTLMTLVTALPFLWGFDGQIPENQLMTSTPVRGNLSHLETGIIMRRKRDLFDNTPWKPWGFTADSLKYEYPEQHNSWWGFLAHLAKGAPGTGPILVIYKHQGSWNPLFNLTTVRSNCTREAVEFIGTINVRSVTSPRYNIRTRKGCHRAANAYINAFYNNNPPLNTVNCWREFCKDNFNPQFPLNITTVAPAETPMEVKANGHLTCVCNDGTGQFVGLSHCQTHLTGKMRTTAYHGGVSVAVDDTTDQNLTMIINDVTLTVNNSLRYHVNMGIGFMYSNYWQCGNQTYDMLPIDWSGCCYLVQLQMHNVMMLRGDNGGRSKRALAVFNRLESYHWRIALGEKWGIGLLPWYGVTFLADHIDNITYTMTNFANETIAGFRLLTDNDKSHRLTLLKHEMALDFLLARTGGLCNTLNLTGEACVTLIPDNSDNLTGVITALEKIRDAFGPSDSAGFSFNSWLQDRLGPWGSMLVQVLIPIFIVFGVVLCFCTCALTFMKALLHRWIGGIVGGQVQQYMQLRTQDDDKFLDLFPVLDWIPPYHDDDLNGDV